MDLIKTQTVPAGVGPLAKRKVPTPQAEMKGNIARSIRLTPKTPQTEINSNKNVMRRVAYNKTVAKNTKRKATVTIVPKFQVTLNVGDRERNTPQKALDILKVRKSPSNAINGASRMVN